MPRPTIVITLVIASLGWLLAACGQAASVAPTPARPAPPTARPTPAPAGGYADIPRGTTPEGYQYLGDPAAPLTMVMYSDYF